MLSDLCRPMRSDKGRLGTHYRRPVRCFLLNNASRLILHPSPRILFLGLYRPFSALLHRRINAASSPSTCCSIVYLRQAPSTFSASRVKVRRLAVYLMFYLRSIGTAYSIISLMRTNTVIRAIGVSHTACSKYEFRRNIRSHS